MLESLFMVNNSFIEQTNVELPLIGIALWTTYKT